MVPGMQWSSFFCNIWMSTCSSSICCKRFSFPIESACAFVSCPCAGCPLPSSTWMAAPHCSHCSGTMAMLFSCFLHCSRPIAFFYMNVRISFYPKKASWAGEHSRALRHRASPAEEPYRQTQELELRSLETLRAKEALGPQEGAFCMEQACPWKHSGRWESHQNIRKLNVKEPHKT